MGSGGPGLASMAALVEGTLESFSHVAAAGIASGRHRLRSHAAAPTGAADEEQLCVPCDPVGVEQLSKTRDKGRIDPAVRERLPLDRHDPLPNLFQIRKPDEGPFCSRPHVDQNRPWIILEVRPHLLDVNVHNTDILTHPASALHNATRLRYPTHPRRPHAGGHATLLK